MTRLKDDKVATALIGIALLLPVFLAMPIAGMASDTNSIAITANVEPSQTLMTGIGLQTNAMSPQVGNYLPKLLIAPNGTGYCVWMRYITAMNKGRAQWNITVMRTVGSVYGPNGWRNWDATTVKRLPNVYQGYYLGFMDAAIDPNGHIQVLFSHDEDTTDFNTTVVKLWDADAGATQVLTAGFVQNWTSGLSTSSVHDITVSIASRGASGHIMFEGPNRFLLWNTGTQLWYRFNDVTGTNQQLSTTQTYFGECSMALDKNNKLIVVYTAGSTVADKKIFMMTATDNWTFGTPSQVSDNAAGIECTSPSVFVDANDVPYVLWSAKYATVAHRYVVRMVKNPAAPVYRNVSTSYGTLPSPAPSGNIAWQAEGAYYNGRINIIYTDQTDFAAGTGGGNPSELDLNILWHSYSIDLSSYSVRLLSNTENYDNKYPSIASMNTLGEDLFIIYDSSVRINIVDLDSTAPLVTVTSQMELELSKTYALTFTIANDVDLATLSVVWDSQAQTVTTASRSVDIPSDRITRGNHQYVIIATDDLGNTHVLTGVVVFTGFDPMMIVTIAIAGAAGAVVILLLVYYNKNRAKFMKRGLTMKMGDKKAPEDTTWGDESPEEEDSGDRSDGSVDLKKDLKKMDL